mgnify:CR=1
MGIGMEQFTGKKERREPRRIETRQDSVHRRTQSPVGKRAIIGLMMSVAVELSDRSIERGGQPLSFPDFTLGGWGRQGFLQVIKPARVVGSSSGSRRAEIEGDR